MIKAYSRIKYKCEKCKEEYMGDEKHECKVNKLPEGLPITINDTFFEAAKVRISAEKWANGEDLPETADDYLASDEFLNLIKGEKKWKKI
jgi:hypothetical protein